MNDSFCSHVILIHICSRNVEASYALKLGLRQGLSKICTKIIVIASAKLFVILKQYLYDSRQESSQNLLRERLLFVCVCLSVQILRVCILENVVAFQFLETNQ